VPFIQIRNVIGENRTISSSNNETIARWLVETLTLFTTPNEAYAGISIRVAPLWVGTSERGAWDWHPAVNQTFVASLVDLTPAGNIQTLAALLLNYCVDIQKGS